MTDHFILQCTCGEIIMQCRCPSTAKTVTIQDGCAKCGKKSSTPNSIWLPDKTEAPN